jgi:hypothetical protein
VSGAKRHEGRNRKRRLHHPTRRDGIIALASLLLPGAIALILSRRHSDVTTVTVWIALAMGLPVIWLAWATYRESRRPDPSGGPSLSEIADRLARAVKAQWESEAAVLRLYDPYPLSVSWVAADPSLTDSWGSIIRMARSTTSRPSTGTDAWATAPDELAGTGSELADVLARVPTRRLVVLGESGSGKTALMLQLVIHLLNRREPGGRVPVLVSVASWNPTEEDVNAWLAGQMAADYPALAEVPTHGSEESSQAAALLAEHWVLPILDGLDEIPKSIRGPAIARINDALQGSPLVLTCRSQQFREALRPLVGPEITLRGAAAVELCPLEAAAVRTYLSDDAGGPVARARWEPVFAELGSGSPAGQALTSPLGRV